MDDTPKISPILEKVAAAQPDPVGQFDAMEKARMFVTAASSIIGSYILSQAQFTSPDHMRREAFHLAQLVVDEAMVRYEVK
jgi:hypothetical protein